ncbi:MAG: DNA polymerase III subunit alpha [Pseudomonadales bacterium]
MFVHLRVHSEFSLLDGLVRVKELAKNTASDAMPAVALSDRFNLYALVKFVRACHAEGVKPICACDVSVIEDEKAAQEPEAATVLTLVVMDDVGYKNLTQLISRAHLEGQRRGLIAIRESWLGEHSDGLLALSGGREGDVGRALVGGRTEEARQRLSNWMAVFPERFYVEVQRTNRENEDTYLQAAVTLADELNCPIVATNDVRFISADQFEAHESRVCIHEGRTLDDPRRPRIYSEQQYFRSQAEMKELFSDLPDAIENTVAIAQRCNLDLQLGEYFLPDYPIPEGSTLEQFFSEESKRGLEQRLEKLQSLNPEIESRRQAYFDRLDFELDVIIQMGFPGYFLIVMDFIRWAKEQGIPVGPGRGSGAGSIVAYALQITDLDPLEYDLLFERFLNPERVSMPDFDVDFCMDGRDEVIQYVADRYGRDAVSQIITFGTMAAKAVVRDVARVQGKPYGLADKLSKMIPFEVGMTLSKAMEQEQSLREFVDESDDVAEIMDMAFQLEGVTRNVGKHAGGVVIAPTELTDFAPLYCDENGAGLVTQFDKDDVESVGLVKFDFLGLRTLTIIDWALKLIDRKKDPGPLSIDINAIPLGDAEVFQLLQNAQTTAVFQLESRGMKDLIKRLLPSNFEDIVALVALFRPGPLQSGMVDDFINRKHGRAKVVYDHPCLEPILENTYGVILYQEQVMQIAQVMAKYTLGQADMLRRAMGKKKPEEMARQKEIFCSGAEQNGIDVKLATHVFDLMEKFAGYGFNKSHSAAYALVSYQTAWLKHHYPSEFMAAVLSADMQNTDKVVLLIEECRSMGLDLVMPDVNIAVLSFTVDDEQQIVYGLGAIKGLGEGPVDSIIAAREAGPFTDLFDFCNRTDARKVNRRAIEALIRAGAFDSLGESRAVLMASLDKAQKSAEQESRNAVAGMIDLFGEMDEQVQDVYEDFRSTKPWRKKDVLAGEKETLGLYLSGHPIDEYQAEIARFNTVRIADLRPEGKAQKVIGLLIAQRTMRSKKGDTIAFITLDDKSARIEVSVFSDVYQNVRDLLVKDALICVEGVVSVDEYTDGFKMRAKGVDTMLQARQTFARAVRINLDAASLPANSVAILRNTLSAADKGSVPVSVQYQSSTARARINFDPQWSVAPSDDFLQRLRAEYGSDNVQLEFGDTH